MAFLEGAVDEPMVEPRRKRSSYWGLPAETQESFVDRSETINKQNAQAILDKAVNWEKSGFPAAGWEMCRGSKFS